MAASSEFIRFTPQVISGLSTADEPVDLVTYNGQKYVVKYLRRSRYGLSNPNEIHIGSGISHPNLGRIDYLLPQKGSTKLGLVMPYYERNAVTSLAASKIDIDARLIMFYELIHVVRELHRSGFVHLDIKPANVVIDSGKIILIDFGSSRRLLGGKYITRHSVMTPGFNPPEDVRGIFHYSTATDVWSLAVTGIFLLTNRNLTPRDVKSHRVFMESLKNNLHEVLESRFQFWPDHPAKRPIIQILASMLTDEPKYRAELDTVLSNKLWSDMTPVPPLTMLRPIRHGNVPPEFVRELSILVDFFRLRFSFAPARCLFLAADLAYRSVDNLYEYLRDKKAAPRRRLFITYVCAHLAIDAEMSYSKSRSEIRSQSLDFFMKHDDLNDLNDLDVLQKRQDHYATKTFDVVLAVGLKGVLYLPSIYDSVSEPEELRTLIDTHLLNPANYNAWTKTCPVEVSNPYTGDVASLFSK